MSSLLRRAFGETRRRAAALPCNASRSRRLHPTSALDPSLPTSGSPSLGDEDAIIASTSAAELENGPISDRCHVTLSFLHASTKPDDLRSGRSRLGKQYVPLSSHLFDMEPRRDILHAAVVYHLDSLRSGTASTKTRGEVNFSGRKIRPQKGSGQARLGTRSNPLLRKGGVIFGPKPRDMSSKLPRRVRELALRSVLSARWRSGSLHVVPSLVWDGPPNTTGKLSRHLSARRWTDALFLTAPRNPEPSDHSLQTEARPSAADPVYAPEQEIEHAIEVANFVSAANNLPRIHVIKLNKLTEQPKNQHRKISPEDKKRPGELPAYEILKRKLLILDLGAVEWLEEKLGGAIFHAEEDSVGDMDQEQREGLTEEEDGIASVAEQIVEIGLERPTRGEPARSVDK